MDRFGVGVRTTLAGTAKLVVLTALLPPHPARPATREIRRAPKAAKPTIPDLPIHPPRPRGHPRGELRLLGMYSLWKISSVEDANLFSKLSRRADVRPADALSEARGLLLRNAHS